LISFFFAYILFHGGSPFGLFFSNLILSDQPFGDHLYFQQLLGRFQKSADGGCVF